MSSLSKRKPRENLVPSAIAIAARIMSDDIFRLNVVSQNLANANTAGYKKELVASRPFIEQLQASAAAATQGSMRGSMPGGALQVSLPALTSVLDYRQGTLTGTNSPLDVAIEGSGFFELAGADGPVYTRAGSFRLDGRSRLASPAGLPVMGLGGEISLGGTQPTIDSQGRVFEAGQLVAQLKVVRFADPRALAPIGGGLYRAESPGQVNAEAFTVRQGFLESSNVAALPEMVHTIELMRRFETAQKIAQSYDGMLGGAIQKLGEF
jgi:flagellar basal-body rod protein FlgF